MTPTVFAAVRNEAPFLLEWIAYHKVIGFDRIVIVSNDCTDTTAELLDALDAAGAITHIAQTVPEGWAPQAAAAALVNASGLIADGDWCLSLDADEFLNIRAGAGRVTDLIDRIGNHEAMLINRRKFGDAGNGVFTGRYVSDAFTRAEAQFPPFTLFKTFFRKSDRLTGFSPWLHRCSLRPGAVDPSEVMNGAGQPLTAARKPRARENHAGWVANGDHSWGRIWRDEIGYDIAQINHYAGRGHAPAGARNTRHTAESDAQHTANEAEDRTILRWSGPVTDLMTQLCEDGAVRQAADRAAAIPAPRAFKLTFSGPVADFVRAEYGRAGSILEYGSGGSTVLGARLGKRVVTVESDAAWAADLRRSLADAGLEAEVHHVDIGRTRDWGFPADSSGWARYPRYPLSVWEAEGFACPDIVLIDGRMRLACLAATALRMTRPLRVLFDDYAGRRRYYHAAERFFPLTRLCERMAVFDLTPGMIPPDRLHEIIPWFFDLR